MTALIAFIISWSGYTGDAVNLYRDGAYLTTVAAYQHVDSTITTGHRYFYYLTCVNDYGEESGPSGVVSGLYLDMADSGDVLSDTTLYWYQDTRHALKLLLPSPASMWTVEWRSMDPDTVTVRCVYDFTWDGYVNLSDMSVLGQGYGTVYDLSDFSAFVSMYGREARKEWRAE